MNPPAYSSRKNSLEKDYCEPFNNSDPPPPYPGISVATPSEHEEITLAASQPHSTTSRSDWEETYRWRLGSSPVDIKCLHCHKYIRTKVKSSPGPLAWMFSTMFCLGGFIAPISWAFCCFPFCVDACKDIEHYCPNCYRFLGRYDTGY